MKKSVLLLAFSVFFISIITNAQEKIKGNGNVIKTSRSTAVYDAIKIAGFFDVELIAGKEGTITLKGEENLLSAIQVEVNDNALKIYTKKGTQIKPSAGNKIEITIPFDKISSVELAGSGDIISKDVIKNDSFLAKIAGSGDVTLAVNATHLEISLSGSGDATLKGSAENLSLKLAGSGNINTSDLKSKKVNATVSGSGDTLVNCNEILVARVAGSGTIKYIGNPEKRDIKVSGSGSITKG